MSLETMEAFSSWHHTRLSHLHLKSILAWIRAAVGTRSSLKRKSTSKIYGMPDHQMLVLCVVLMVSTVCLSCWNSDESMWLSTLLAAGCVAVICMCTDVQYRVGCAGVSVSYISTCSNFHPTVHIWHMALVLGPGFIHQVASCISAFNSA